MKDYKQLEAASARKLAEGRVLMEQWCKSLFDHYVSLPKEVQDKLPQLPGSTAHEMVPSLYVDPPTQETIARFEQEKAVLTNIQQQCVALAEQYNQSEEVRCLL